MQAVLLAAGSSNRFYPFNKTHKSLFVLQGQTILEHTLKSVEDSGISDVIIIIGRNSPIPTILKKKKFIFALKFVEQEKPLGMGDALLKAESLLEEDFFLLHSHHVEFAEFKNILQQKKSSPGDVILLGKKATTMDKFGAVRLSKDRVLEIVEKPVKGEEPSNIKVVGIYLIGKKFLETLKKAPKDHYNFEKALSLYASSSNVLLVKTEKEVISLKYPWDLLVLNNYLLKHQKRSVSKKASIAESVDIVGDVVVEEGAKILEGARILGPCYIGKSAFVGNNAIVRNSTTVEEHAVVGAQMELKNTIISKDSTTHSGFIGDSVIGVGCKIAAGFVTGNVRLDRGNIIVKSEKGKIDSGIKSFGIIIGNTVNVGINVSTMPGVIIGNTVTIGPSTTIKNNIKENTLYYTKFHEIIEKNT